MSDGPNLYAYCLNNPVNAVDLWGNDTYYINNKFFTSTPTDNPFSHSFVATTDFDPTTGRQIVTNTYSWTDEGGGSWHPNSPQDILGAQRAIDSGIGSEWYGNENLDYYISEQYSNRFNESGDYNILWNNCKQKSGRLIEDAVRQMQEESKENNKP